MSAGEAIDAFLAEGPWAVAGASRERSKYGNKVLRSYLQAGLAPVFPVNPNESAVEDLPAFPDLASCPEPVRAVSIITPPPVTETIVDEALALGIRHLWMQPGAESTRAVERAREAGASVIAGGPCLLVKLRFRE